ncbi:MAG: hypothetical protein K9G62_08810 [Alphaproteobacteria bacterium]|nr:hypothetical protein [Alphaproteobacteria bacterium]
MIEIIRLRGHVHNYSEGVNAGTIKGENKKMYLFSRKDWLSPHEPKPNVAISFEEERKWARSITISDDK